MSNFAHLSTTQCIKINNNTA